MDALPRPDPADEDRTFEEQDETLQQKKVDSYKKDRRLKAEYPHSFRRKWPKKKARAERKYRRRIHQLLTGLRLRAEGDQIEDFPADPLRRPKPHKWPGTAQPLGAFLRQRRRTRVQKVAWNYFKEPYNGDRHCQPFSAFLREVSRGRGDPSRELTRAFERLHSSQREPGGRENSAYDPWRSECRRRWLQAFLQDEPEWEGRLLDWIRSFDESD
jgi:hypothetical protein